MLIFCPPRFSAAKRWVLMYQQARGFVRSNVVLSAIFYYLSRCGAETSSITPVSNRCCMSIWRGATIIRLSFLRWRAWNSGFVCLSIHPCSALVNHKVWLIWNSQILCLKQERKHEKSDCGEDAFSNRKSLLRSFKRGLHATAKESYVKDNDFYVSIYALLLAIPGI